VRRDHKETRQCLLRKASLASLFFHLFWKRAESGQPGAAARLTRAPVEACRKGRPFVAISCYKSMSIEFVHSVMTLIMNRPVELEVMFDQAECPAEAPPIATTTTAPIANVVARLIEPFVSLSHCCVESKKTESPRGTLLGNNR
jgi:hypothetical protein